MGHKNLIQKGFTLLELLVVMGIIAVLIGLGAVSYATAQQKARDAKRKADLRSIQNCMEQNYANNTTSPYQYQTLTAGALQGTLDCGGTVTMSAPTDPLNDGTTYYYHVVSSSSTTYDITAALENGSAFEITNEQ